MKNLRKSLLIIFALVAFGPTAWAQFSGGSGTEADPYLISSADDWNTLSDNVSNDIPYTGQFFKLTADISVTKMLGKYEHNFKGNFDGDGHTLDFNIDTDWSMCAPFRYAENVTIKNLHVTGLIFTIMPKAAGFVAVAYGNVNIINCRSSIEILAIWPDGDKRDGFHGGFVAMCSNATVNIVNGLFDGEMLGFCFKQMGGFVGIANDGCNVNLVNCLCDPQVVDLDGCNGSETFIGSKVGNVTMSHCFYTEKIGKAEGTEAKGWNNTQYLFALGSGWHEVDGKVLPDMASQTYDYSLAGEGTAASPYLIGSVADWNKLVVSPSIDGTSGKYYKMTQDITLAETVSSGFRTTMVGTSKDASFKGTFDGDGHTLTVNYTDNSSDHYTAPFRFINGATINNLHVTGTISKEKKKHAGGLVGQAFGENRFNNCRSSVTIEANTDGDGSHGGFIGDLRDGYTVLSYCLFDGKMQGPNNSNSQTEEWGGFIGWVAGDGEANFKHCLFAPTSIKISDKDGCYTFARRKDSDDLTFTNCYYTQLLGGSQAKQARSISGNENVTVAPYGTVSQHNVSGITTYSLGSAGIAINPCIFYNDILYSGNGSGVALSPSQVGETPAGAQANSFIATPGSLSLMTDYYNLSMTDADQIISLAPSDWTSHAGTEADPYLIYTTEQWNLLADRVNNQNQTYSGKFFKLMADITVGETVSSGTPITMVGTSDSKSFQGTFDGNGHTITLNYNDTRDTDFCAPFCYINGATIKFLHVSGTIYKTKGKNAGGFVGKAVGDNTIDNCRSSVDIHFNKEGDVSSGGFIGELRESGSTTFNNCLFDGKLRGTNAKSWGGFVGWVASGRTVTFNNCLCAPTVVNINADDSKTFARKDGTVNVNNCYYKTLINDAQGATDAASYSNATLLDALGLGWETIMENEVEKVVPIMAVYPFSGDGTEDVPFLITSTEDWNHLASNQFLNVNYNGKYFQLTNNISVTRMVGYDPNHAFQGTFDGSGNTITVNYGTAASPMNIQYAAPFKNAYGATIKNLHTTGTIYTANTHSGGVVGRNGTGNLTMTNVTSDVTINSTYSGNAHHGGLVGYTLNATLTGCSFTGKLLGSSSAKCGGLMGWKTSTASTSADFYDCLFAPTEVTVSTTDSKTFVVDNGTVSFTNCYYTAPLGTAQAKQARTISAGKYVTTMENAGTATEYEISGITSYGSGILYDSVLYAGNGDVVSLSLGYTLPESFEFYGYQASAGTLTGSYNPYTLSMPDADVTITADYSLEWPGNGTEESPYLIYHPEQLDLLATNVNNGNQYVSTRFKLMADLEYNHDGLGEHESNYTPIGTDTHTFSGIFDGNGHTISGIRVYSGGSAAADNYKGLFGYVNGNAGNSGVVKNLILTDAGITGHQYCGGIAGYNYCGTIDNCHVTSSVIIHGAQTTAYYHGGIVGQNTSGASNAVVTHCSSSATLTGTNTSSYTFYYYGGIVGNNEGGVTTDNLAIGAVVQKGRINTYGAISGRNNTGTMTNNYYINCTVDGVENAIEVGCGNADITANDGAVPGNKIFLAEHITSDATVFTIPTVGEIEEQTFSVAAFGATVTLGYELSGYEVTYHVDEAPIEGNTFTMPNEYVESVVVDATLIPIVTLEIAGYGDSEESDHWAFIASPVEGSIEPTEVGNIFSATEYDLYRFNQSAEKEWENYQVHTDDFVLENGQGYLYATKETQTLIFTGEINTSTEPVEVPLIYDASRPFAGFNLVGNPFTVEAYVDRPFYQMNNEGSDIEPVENYDSYSPVTIPMCTGIMVKAEAEGESVTFSTTTPNQKSMTNNGSLQMTLTKANGRSNDYQDKAIVSFNEGSKLEKFIFNENHAKLYIPQDGEDYAIAFSDRKGSVPVHFKANETGRYTITFDGEDMSGISLIDKFENVTIDLGVNDSYTFMASSADSRDRFLLVFKGSEFAENSENFAYQSGNEIIVNGEGTLEVFDVMGRMVMNQRINGVESINAMPYGVYIFRLNGKTQKIVVR